MKMNPATTVDIACSRAVPSRRTASWQQWALVSILTIVAFGTGLGFAPNTLHFNVAESAAARHLSGFGAVESNDHEAYRWSKRDAVIRLFGLARRPVIVDLRMTSPRPADAAPAETRLLLGSWRSNVFVIEGGWRRYQVLLPSRPGAPDLRFETRTFRPAKESDKRDLGAAFTRVAVYPADGRSVQTGALVTLGLVRAFMLLLVPIALFAALSRVGSRVVAWFAAACAAVLVAVAAAHPVDTVRLIPDLWLIPIGTAVGVAIFAGTQPYLTPPLSFLRRILASDAARLGAVLMVAGVQGLIFLILVPPWQHYDEPAHFEYAWLLAFHPSWPVPGTINPAITWIGGEGRALSHLPTYHLLVSLPLRLTSGWGVFEQLYLARAVSLALFIATIAIIGGIAQTLFHDGHPMRWLMPLVAALIPPFADIMTAVNNDVGAIMAFSLFLWSVVHIYVVGWSVRRAMWVIGAALIAVLMKNVTLIALLLAPIVLLAAFGFQRRWRLQRLVAAVSGSVALITILSLSWGDPAAWYRYGGASVDGAARMADASAPHGRYVFRLTAEFSPYEFSGVAVPIVSADLPAIANGPVTIGAWVWASHAATIAGPGVMYNDGSRDVEIVTPAIDVDTTPRFVAWTFDAPRALSSLQVFLPAPPLSADPSLEVFIDGVVAAKGTFSDATTPIFDQSATGGSWNGQVFVNLVRNGSAEQAWLYVRPEVERTLRPLVRRSLQRIVTSVFDIERTGPIVLLEVAPDLITRSFVSFGWGEVMPSGSIWRWIFPLALAGALVGCIRWLIVSHRSLHAAALVTFLAIGALIWANAALRILPALIAQPPPFPRYGFPAIGPLTLVLAAGWLAWWPLRWRSYAIAALVIALLMLNAVAYVTIWRHWYV